MLNKVFPSNNMVLRIWYCVVSFGWMPSVELNRYSANNHYDQSELRIINELVLLYTVRLCHTALNEIYIFISLLQSLS